MATTPGKIAAGKIAVVGLGYVGLPLAVAFAKHFEGVVGFDIDAKRVAALKAGKVLDDSFPSTVHPNTLYHSMKDKTMVDCGRNVNAVTISFG